MIVPKKNFVCFQIGEQHVCEECLDQEKDENIQLLTREELENDAYVVCDRCDKLIG